MLHRTPPLVVPAAYDGHFQVEVQTGNPLLPNKNIALLTSLSLQYLISGSVNDSSELASFYQFAPGGSAYERYLDTMQKHSVVITLALQLKADAEHGIYRNIAHVLALLYQATFTVPRLLPFQHRIQEQFDSIKTALTSTGALDTQQREWIHVLTTEVVTQALYGPDNGIVPGALAHALRE